VVLAKGFDIAAGPTTLTFGKYPLMIENTTSPIRFLRIWDVSKASQLAEFAAWGVSIWPG
jgi:hypothetical protein